MPEKIIIKIIIESEIILLKENYQLEAAALLYNMNKALNSIMPPKVNMKSSFSTILGEEE